MSNFPGQLVRYGWMETCITSHSKAGQHPQMTPSTLQWQNQQESRNEVEGWRREYQGSCSVMRKAKSSFEYLYLCFHTCTGSSILSHNKCLTSNTYVLGLGGRLSCIDAAFVVGLGFFTLFHLRQTHKYFTTLCTIKGLFMLLIRN